MTIGRARGIQLGGGTIATASTLVVTPATVELEEDDTQQLTATVKASNGVALSVTRGVDGTSQPIAVGYESDDEGVATVSASGLVTAVAEGECVITATVTGSSPAITDTVAVTVTAA